MCKDTYNGWKNRETWATMSHLDNDELLRCSMYELAARAKSDAPEGRASFRLAAYLEEWVTRIFGDFFEYPLQMAHLKRMIMDIGSLWRVDWVGIADHVLEEIADQ